MTMSVPFQLSQVVVSVTIADGFPPTANSKRDTTLLRAANRALIRKEAGATDAFLFVFVGKYDINKISEAVAAYGFPNVSVNVIENENYDEFNSQDREEMQESASLVISKWLSENHPSAIAFPGSDFDTENFWWTGIKQGKDGFELEADIDSFSPELPDTHRTCAATWMSVLGHAFNLAHCKDHYPIEFDGIVAAEWAATLCEWLHGFEAASGNGYNHFDPISVCRMLGFSDFFLGFELSRVTGDTFGAACGGDYYGDKFLSIAILAITRNIRPDLRNMLSKFFGGDPQLFWVLHSSIWPKFDKPMAESMDLLWNSQNLDHIEEVMPQYLFVKEGWCEESDQDYN